jgi:hypothetical protein
MGKHIRRLLEGMSQSLALDPGSDYVIPRRGDFRRDIESLRRDAKKIGNGLRKNVPN